MTAKEIITILRFEGWNASQIAKILDIGDIYQYTSKGGTPSWRIEKRIQKKFKIYKLTKLCDAINTQMG